MPYHILAKPEDIADRAVVVGDPGRAEYLSKFLENTKLVNEHRGLLTYTGEWRGVRVTVSTHGMGGPGAAIIFEELIELGAKVLIRFGTTGGIKRGIKVGDVVIPLAAYHYPGGIFKMYVGDYCAAAVPHFDVVKALVEEAEKEGARAWVDPVFSSDGFYAENRELVEKWASMGAVSVEMECATLFMVARLRGVKAGAILLVNGSHVEPVDRLILESTLEEAMERTARIALNAVVRVPI